MADEDHVLYPQQVTAKNHLIAVKAATKVGEASQTDVDAAQAAFDEIKRQIDAYYDETQRQTDA